MVMRELGIEIVRTIKLVLIEIYKHLFVKPKL